VEKVKPQHIVFRKPLEMEHSYNTKQIQHTKETNLHAQLPCK